MPAPPPVAYATIAQALPSRPYILSITPSTTGHLLLRHPSTDITIADAQSLQAIDRLRDGHKGHVTDIAVDAGATWSGAKDGSIIRWDERSRRPASGIKAFVRKPVPVTALAVSETDHLVIAGTEQVSAESHILYYDTRNSKTPAYQHSSTHSDDITHLSLLPSTSTYLASPSSKPLPSRLLLSASTDGLVALSDLKESDEDEAVQCAENWGQSVAAAGVYTARSGLKIWARSDMDGVSIWDLGLGGADDEGQISLEMRDQVEYPSEEFKFRQYTLPSGAPAVVSSAAEEMAKRDNKVKSDYLIDVVPSLGISKNAAPMTAVGTNEGDIVLQHYASSSSTAGKYQPSAYFLSGPDTQGVSRGHKDVIRAIHHDVRSEAIYTGSEDGVLAGWSLAGLPRLRVGDPERDDDGGDGREDIESGDEDDESEIETESSDQMDVDDDDDNDDDDDGMRNHRGSGGRKPGPILGRAAGRAEKRKGHRPQPY